LERLACLLLCILALVNALCPDLTHLDSDIASDPASPLVFQALDRITEGALEDAGVCLKKAQELAPNDPNLHFALGLFHEESGDADKAHLHYEQAV